jgi:hypothetical protein
MYLCQDVPAALVTRASAPLKGQAPPSHHRVPGARLSALQLPNHLPGAAPADRSVVEG